MTSVFEPGDKLHIVEHRSFQDDNRRHFIGEVEATSERAVRLSGFLFIYEKNVASFLRRGDRLTRVFALENTIGITVMPKETDLEAMEYRRDDKGHGVTDGAGVRFDVSIFGPHG